MKKIYKIYFDFDNNKKQKLLHQYFFNKFKKYEKRCKVIYVNKIFELDKLSLILSNKKKSFDLKIISFIDLQDFINEIQNDVLFYVKEKNKKIKINSDILPKI